MWNKLIKMNSWEYKWQTEAFTGNMTAASNILVDLIMTICILILWNNAMFPREFLVKWCN